jgi:hypothetical protein
MGDMRVLLSALLAAFAMAAVPASGFAAPASARVAFEARAHAKPSPSPDEAGADAEPDEDGGTIEGRVASIDYHSGRMTVDVPEGGGKKSYSVLVVPGTNIQGQKDFHTIADLKRGAHVQVLLSRHGSTNTAQIIRLL